MAVNVLLQLAGPSGLSAGERGPSPVHQLSPTVSADRVAPAV